MGFEIEYYKLLKYINQVVIGQKIPSNSKLIYGPMLGGSQTNANLLITPESLKAVDQFNESNESFLKLIGEFFGQEFITYTNGLIPIATLVLLGSKSNNMDGGASTDLDLKYLLLPIVTIIAGYYMKDEMGEQKFQILVSLCVCYCIYWMVMNQSTQTSITNTLINKILGSSEFLIPESKFIDGYKIYEKSNGNIIEHNLINSNENIFKIKIDRLFDNDYYLSGSEIKNIENTTDTFNLTKYNLDLQKIKYSNGMVLFKDKDKDEVKIIDIDEYGNQEIVSLTLPKNYNYKQEIKQFIYLSLGSTIGKLYFILLNDGTLHIILYDYENYKKILFSQTVQQVKQIIFKEIIIKDQQNLYNSIYYNKYEILKEDGIIYNIDRNEIINNKSVTLKEVEKVNKTDKPIDSYYILRYIHPIYFITYKDGSRDKIITTNNDTFNEDLENLFKKLLKQEPNNLSGGSNLLSLLNPLNFVKMIASAGTWILTNIRSHISNSLELMSDWIKSPNKTWNSFYSLLYKVATGMRSNLSKEILQKIKFNGATGNIEYSGHLSSTIETIITPKIKMYIKNNKLGIIETTYTFENKPLETISYIEARPVATALVLAYTESLSDKSSLTGLSGIKDLSTQETYESKYLFEIDSEGNVQIFKKSDNSELQSIQKSVNHWLRGQDVEARGTAENVCKEMFGVDKGLGNSTCSNYFYSVLGKSVLNMIKTIGAKIETSKDVKDLILSSNPAIKYELVKKLDWKVTFTNGNKKLVDVSKWISIQRQDIKDYLGTSQGQVIKLILEQLVEEINKYVNLIDIAEQAYEANDKNQKITDPNFNSKRKTRRLTETQVAALRSRQISDTSKLIQTAPISLTSLNFSTRQSGGYGNSCYHEFNGKLNQIKSRLSGGGKVLSTNTETKLVSMIEKLDQLEQKNSLGYSDQLIRVTNAFGKLSSHIN